MIVYHGTGCDRLPSLLGSGPQIIARPYLNGRRAFSTTEDFEIAALFALRKSPPSILSGDEREAGVVLEYRISETAKRGRDWTPAKESGVLQDEREIAVFKISILELQAVHRLENSVWVRQSLNELAQRG
jgi:hypothetical protein